MSTPAVRVASRIQPNIREANLGDTAVVTDFNLRLAWETENRRLDPARVWQGVATLLADPAKGIYFVAEVQRVAGTVIAGQLLITYEWSDWRNGTFWWIQSVYVAAEFRDQGIFRALFQHVQNLANARADVCGLRLYMDLDNTTARRAYERLGLKQTSYQVFEIDFLHRS